MNQLCYLGEDQSIPAPFVPGRRGKHGALVDMEDEANRVKYRSKTTPTFALLREKRQLRVSNPENGVCFTITMRDWQEMLWAVRVHPEPEWQTDQNAYTTAHRILPRRRIEDWLAELRLV